MLTPVTARLLLAPSLGQRWQVLLLQGRSVDQLRDRQQVPVARRNLLDESLMKRPLRGDIHMHRSSRLNLDTGLLGKTTYLVAVNG